MGKHYFLKIVTAEPHKPQPIIKEKVILIMAPAPPPPPPPANLPNFATNNSSKKPAGIPNTSALLKSIEKGTRLKKTTTNDRSAPLISSQPNSTATNNMNQNPSASSGTANSTAPSGLGGLFANGFPALRSTKASSKSTVEIPTVLQNPVKMAAAQAKESIARDPERAINVAKKGVKIAAPIVASELTGKNPIIQPTEDTVSSVRSLARKTNIIPELPKKMEREPADRWNFKIDSDDNLPSPRKFTGAKKIYISQIDGRDDTTKSTNDALISKDDMEGFIKSLKSKLNKAASEENFEECVRLKTKLKAFQLIETRVKAGECVYANELPR